MDTLLKKLNDIKEVPLPYNISAVVMKRIFIAKIKYLLVVFSGLFLTFLILLNRIYRIIIETEVISVIKVIIEDFELSWSYINDSLISIFEVIPKTEIILIAINGGIMAGIALYLFLNYRSEKKLFFNSPKN